MRFKQKLTSHYEIVSSEDRLVKKGTYTLYRGVKDIFPNEINPRFNGKGVFGKGTYFATSARDAERWADGSWSVSSYDKFALVCTYKITFKSLLMISPEMLYDLHNAVSTLTLDAEDLAEFLGFEVGDTIQSDSWSQLVDDMDGVHFAGDADEIDGGEQVLIFPQSKVVPKLVQMKLLVKDCSIADKIHQKLGGKLIGAPCGIDKIPASKIDALDRLMRDLV